MEVYTYVGLCKIYNVIDNDKNVISDKGAKALVIVGIIAMV